MDTKLEDILETHNTRFGKVGLRNLGNTCFMASAIQCLSHCEDLTKFFLLRYYENDINKDSQFGSGGHIANSYYQLIVNLWNSNLDYLSPTELRHVLVKIVKKFQGFSQQDSHELLTYLLDSLHEDMNRNHTKPYIEMKEKTSEETDLEASKRWWTNHLKRENSIIVDLFQGQYKGTITCPKCDKISITYDPFMYLGLPIPLNQNKVVIKYFPNILRDFEYIYHNIDIPLSGNSNFKAIDFKVYLNQNYAKKFNNFNANKNDLSKISRWFDLVLLTNDKMFKRIVKDEEEIAKVFENEGEIVAYERYPNKDNFNERHDSVFYLNPINLREENSMFFFNKTKPNNLYYPIALTVNRKENIKDLFFDVFKIYRKVIKDRQKTDINIAMENLNLGKFDYLRKEFEIFFKLTKNEKNEFDKDFKDNSSSSTANSNNTNFEGCPFDLFFMNNIPEPSGYFSTKQICEFCSNKKCEFCRVCDNFDFNQPINNIFKKIKLDRTICIFLNLKEINKNKFFNNQIFPFDIENIMKIPLIIKSNEVNIYNCLNLFRSEEKLENDNSWYCSNCKEHQEATKKMEIFKAPNILIIQLKRFKIKSTNAIIGMLKNGKNESKIEYPITGLDLRNYVVGDDSSQIYDLIGISQHFGSLSSGHYTALCKNQNKWYEFDDECVNLYPENKVVNSSAYLLFYRRRNEN
jgi:ubiquitin C-terminal hydrolase